MHTSRAIGLAVGFVLLVSLPASAVDRAAPVPRPEGWLIKSFDELKSPPPPDTAAALGELKAAMARRTEGDIERIRWWAVGGPVYRWNEIALEELLDGFVTLPLAARHLALVHAAMDDAVAAAWQDKNAFRVARPSTADPTIKAALPVPASPSYPSDHAAAAAAASAVLAHLFPARAAAISARADEAMRMRAMSGIEYPADIVAGGAIGRKVAELAIARAKSDGADAKWSGSVPEGPGKWKGTNPIAPAAAGWKPWLLARNDELRPPAPPAFESEQVRAALDEVRQFQRSPKSNHRAIYWEVFGGARAFALWNDTARARLLEYGDSFDELSAARTLATLNVTLADAGIACWDAKYAYWYVRPSQVDPELKTVIPVPNHPSYPSAHSCYSTGASTVLATLFAADRDRLLALGKEASEARIWAGIHYRFDLVAGEQIGRQVAQKALARAFVPRTQ